MIIEAIKRRFPRVKAPPSEDICYATTNRQAAVRQIAPECDLVLVVGSKNSSNSVRLTEISENVGTRARLLDDASELDASWFAGLTGSILVTAGASAPEDLVAGLCREIVERFGASIEQRDVYPEDVEFGLPLTLKRAMVQRGIDPGDRRVVVEAPVISADRYGATALTISAKNE